MIQSNGGSSIIFSKIRTVCLYGKVIIDYYSPPYTDINSQETLDRSVRNLVVKTLDDDLEFDVGKSS